MRKRTARILRRAADRLDPKPARWYASAWQQSPNMSYDNFTTASGARFSHVQMRVGGTWERKPPRRRVLADFLSPFDLKKLRP